MFSLLQQMRSIFRSFQFNICEISNLSSMGKELIFSLICRGASVKNLVKGFNLPLAKFFIISLFSIIITSLVSIYPAMKASKLDTIKSLKYE